MAGIFERLSMIFKSKANKALDKHEDPRETLDYSYQRQLELLQKVRRGVADVATSRKRVEIQGNQLGQEMDKLTLAAQRALSQDREDLAREALTRKSGLQAQLSDLQAQHAALAEEEEKLIRASTQLQARVDAFRTKKETIKAQYSAAEAQTRVNEAFTGLSDELGDVGQAIARAEEAPGRGWHWGSEATHPDMPRGQRVHVGTTGTLEQILYGPSTRADGSLNFVGALKRAMSTTGYAEVKDLQRAQVVVSPYSAS